MKILMLLIGCLVFFLVARGIHDWEDRTPTDLILAYGFALLFYLNLYDVVEKELDKVKIPHPKKDFYRFKRGLGDSILLIAILCVPIVYFEPKIAPYYAIIIVGMVVGKTLIDIFFPLEVN